VESGLIRKQVKNHLDLETTIVDQRRVLIASDDAEFARQVSGGWQAERTVPVFTAQGSDAIQNFDRPSFDLAIVGPVRANRLKQVLRALDPNRQPVILVSDPAQTTASFRAEFPRLLSLRQEQDWTDTLLMLASEVLRRVEAVSRAERAEQINGHLKCHATLGQYVIDMRHTMNNALTSVLGNAELMLLEPGAFSAGVRSQIDTIRNMALRLHEILQRFSSLEKELAFAERQAAKEQGADLRAAVAGP
jgi:signal transduction histidine kinase